MLKTVLSTITLFVILLGLASCGEPVESNAIPVDPVFREYYEMLGGEQILGPAISVMYEESGMKLQFTTAVLMIFDPQAPESARFRLASLGNALKVAEPPLNPISPNGHEIYAGFLPLFRQLGGTRNTGQPITDVKVDPEHNRIVQYFENVGFYQLESDPPDVAHLLDFGVWKCAQACDYTSPQESIVIPPSQPGFGIAGAVDRLDPGLTGFPLTEIYIASDGKEEQIFENVVIYTDPTSPAGIALRPLPQWLEIRTDIPTFAALDDGKFIAVEDNQGFNVPYHFDEYIERHNGYEFVGKPITTYKQITDDLYRQCFENLCLNYRPSETEGLQIRPMALGRRYNQQYASSAMQEEGITNSFDSVTLTVWERYPVITSGDVQKIEVMVLDGGNPLKNIDLLLTLTMPDGSQQTQNFAPTGQDGQAHLELAPIEGSNGTLVPYSVCIENVPEQLDCISDDFLIWGNP